jgi:hypothetical protein
MFSRRVGPLLRRFCPRWLITAWTRRVLDAHRALIHNVEQLGQAAI